MEEFTLIFAHANTNRDDPNVGSDHEHAVKTSKDVLLHGNDGGEEASEEEEEDAADSHREDDESTRDDQATSLRNHSFLFSLKI